MSRMSDDTQYLAPEDETVDPDFDPPRPRQDREPEGDESSLEDLPERIRIEDDEEDTPPEESPQESKVTELTEEERSTFQDLMTVGRRSRTVTLFDHKVVLQTLNVDDEVMIGQATKDFIGSQTFPRAWQSATVAAAIRSVDGEAWGQSLFADADSSALFQEKWAKVRKMYPLVIQSLYNEVVEMEVEFGELARKLGKL